MRLPWQECTHAVRAAGDRTINISKIYTSGSIDSCERHFGLFVVWCVTGEKVCILLFLRIKYKIYKKFDHNSLEGWQNMTVAECLLAVIAQGLIIFAVAEYEGSNLKVLSIRRLLNVCMVYFLIQACAMGLGYLIAQLPLVTLLTSRAEFSRLNARIVAVAFLIIGCYIVYRAFSWKHKEEKLRELAYSRIAMEAVLEALYTLIVGIACGMMHFRIDLAFLIVFLCAIFAVIAGLYTGYAQGDRFHKLGYSLSGILFAVTGVEIIARYM